MKPHQPCCSTLMELSLMLEYPLDNECLSQSLFLSCLITKSFLSYLKSSSFKNSFTNKQVLLCDLWKKIYNKERYSNHTATFRKKAKRKVQNPLNLYGNYKKEASNTNSIGI